jgi:thioredoxin reductase
MQKVVALAIALAAGLAAQEFDLVVYGATAGGVMTAVSGARHGLKAVLLEPGRHVGGMVTGGLSGTDMGKGEVIGGMMSWTAICSRWLGCPNPGRPKG